jgi:hypothetical protein
MADDLTPVMTAEDRRRSERLSQEKRRPPGVVPGYELERPLGEGAFGEVWVALNRNTGYRVAIKFYSSRGGLDWSLLAREVEKLRFLKADRYVVQLHEVGWNASPPYYVMDYMEAGSLEEWLRRGLPPVESAVAMARDVATGLVHAHAKGILHCDLKPANTLLDQDGKPRLADFGQARLAQEQSAALGTLFYMAPEQASLKAVPDARWDVYALGAILYRMLTGELPYRTEAGATTIEQAPDLEERLRRYREFLKGSARPTAHRCVAGVDRSLADIVDRCLAVRPEDRYPNATAVLDALTRRSLQRARFPLLILGAVGPALLAAVVALFAWRGFTTAVGDADGALRQRALLGNRFAAEFAAASVARRMNQRWAILEQVSGQEAFHDRIRRSAGKGPDSPERAALQEWLDGQRDHYLDTTSAKSWFFVDAQGYLLAVSPLSEKSRGSLGKRFHWRTYFHGGDRDYPPEQRDRLEAKPITRAAQSIVFESTDTDRPRMVVFSAPVRDRDRTTLGVLGMGVALGDFTELRPGAGAEGGGGAVVGGRRAVLVETRPDWEGQEGLILQHPWLEPFRNTKRQSPKVRLPAELVTRLQELGRLTLEREEAKRGRGQAPHEPGPGEKDLALLPDYDDPVRDASRSDPQPWSQDYAGTWLAAAAPVIVYPRKDGEPLVNTGWVVIVQERSRDALEPVQNLKRDLLLQGVETLAMLLFTVALLWVLVLVVQSDSSRSRVAAFVRRRAGLRTSTVGTSASAAWSGAAPAAVADPGGPAPPRP